MNLAYLKEQRKRKNLTQKEVDETIGISHIAYRFLETGKRNTSLEILVKLVKILELDANKLLNIN